MSKIQVRLAGASVEWLEWNSSWGNNPHEDEVSKATRTKVLAAPHRKVGKGYQVRLPLALDEAHDLHSILDSIAGAGESMTSEERGGDAYDYRVMRRDADRIRDQLAEQGVAAATHEDRLARIRAAAAGLQSTDDAIYHVPARIENDQARRGAIPPMGTR